MQPSTSPLAFGDATGETCDLLFTLLPVCIHPFLALSPSSIYFFCNIFAPSAHSLLLFLPPDPLTSFLSLSLTTLTQGLSKCNSRLCFSPLWHLWPLPKRPRLLLPDPLPPHHALRKSMWTCLSRSLYVKLTRPQHPRRLQGNHSGTDQCMRHERLFLPVHAIREHAHLLRQLPTRPRPQRLPIAARTELQRR